MISFGTVAFIGAIVFALTCTWAFGMPTLKTLTAVIVAAIYGAICGAWAIYGLFGGRS